MCVIIFMTELSNNIQLKSETKINNSELTMLPLSSKMSLLSIFGVLAQLSPIFQLYTGGQF